MLQLDFIFILLDLIKIESRLKHKMICLYLFSSVFPTKTRLNNLRLKAETFRQVTLKHLKVCTDIDMLVSVDNCLVLALLHISKQTKT